LFVEEDELSSRLHQEYSLTRKQGNINEKSWDFPGAFVRQIGASLEISSASEVRRMTEDKKSPK
jgi:hypothetical protein